MNVNQSQSRETTYFIRELCCATEELLIRKKLQNFPGVEELEFNLITHNLRVRHGCAEDAIARQLSAIGMPGIISSSQEPRRDRSYARLLISTGTSGFLFLAGLAMHFTTNPEPAASIIFLVSLAAGGWHIAAKAFRAVRSLALEMNSLMVVASLGAIVLGQFAEGSAVVFLFSVSLLLESASTERTRNAIRSMMKLSPATGTVVRGDKEETVPLEEIEIGEVVIVRPGERLPVDGVIRRGGSSIEEAAITGEPLPSPKGPGDTVYAGTFNQRGVLFVETTKKSKDSTIARIIHLVEEAQHKKAPSQTAVEQFARYYTPTVFALAIAVALAPPLILGEPISVWFYRSLVLLVIACPCALVISTPVALASAVTNAARNGVLIKGGKHLEVLAKIDAFAFDKTGTLTEGKATVTDVVSLNTLSPAEILRIAAAAELHSEHHLADALLRKAEESGVSLADMSSDGFSSLTGKGIRTQVNGTTYLVGNRRLVEELGVFSPQVEQSIAQLEGSGKTVVLLAEENRVLGLIGISDQIRKEGRSTIRSLHGLGIKHIALLTGDNKGTAAAVANELGVDDVLSDLMPEGKLSVVGDLRRRYGPVAMVGDGINDAPALAASDVGIAVGGAGSDVALEAGSIVLLSNKIERIPDAIRLARKTTRIIWQNISLALLTKAAFLVLGVFGWTSLWLAILADDGATLVVILNALRILRNPAQIHPDK